MRAAVERIPCSDDSFERDAAAHVDEQLHATAVRTDRMFAWLMGLQWLAAIAAALWLSPRAWSGMESSVHIHVWSAFLLGGILSALPIFLALVHPGAVLTRHVIAVAQALWSALLIHLTGGRIETHFHVFGSLAILASYRRWPVLVTATIVVAVDHALRGVWWPESVYGVAVASPWRSLEHAAWVLFEDVFLAWSIRQSLADMQRIARNQVRLERARDLVEEEVQLRTRELHDQIGVRMRAEKQLAATHQQLLTAARRAGMADVATSVLHNVGNVLNSINVSSSIATDRVRRSKVSHLAEAVELMERHENDLGDFIANDPRGRQLPGFLKLLAKRLQDEHGEVLAELDALTSRLDHVKKIVSAQQSHASAGGFVERTEAVQSLDEALAFEASSLEKHGIEVIREYEGLPAIELDRQKLLQILVNLVRNAKDALLEMPSGQRRLTCRIRPSGEQRFQIVVQDNGAGIPKQNLTRIFSHGFTTKPHGHGFGLHSCAIAVREMGGCLSVHSDGSQCGATFTLELPIAAPSGAPRNARQTIEADCQLVG
ncbi:MAG TPA: ATP-binding protein [Pirellulales bacterium]|nr:ATP-binding protein [Pirellulales bacterium]